jgi:hypothetical protein
MPAAEDQIVAVRRPSGRAQGETGEQRGACGALADRQSAAAPSALSHWRSQASHSGGPGRQAGRHRRVPWMKVGRWAGRHFGAAGRPWSIPDRQGKAAVTQAGSPPHGARSGQ